MSSPSLNFIVGIGRSGTTLLMSMLNAHPQLQATPEVNFFVFFYNSWKNKTEFTEKDFLAVESYLQMFIKRKPGSAFSWDISIFKKCIQTAPKINFETIYQCFYQAFIYANTSKVFTQNFDKNPINTLFLNDIINQFPNSKFIYLVRDPRANFLSRKEKINRRKPNVYSDSFRWKLYNKSALKVVEKHKDKFFILKYEDLVLNPQERLQEIAKFFNFPYDDCMLNFHLNITENNIKKINENPESIQSKAIDKYEKLGRPVNTDRLNVWEQKLSKEEIEICTAICSASDKFGYITNLYNPSYNWLSFFKGFYKAKKEILKNKIIYRIPLSIKMKRI